VNIKNIISKITRTAIREDIYPTDITTENFISPDLVISAEIIFKEPAVICGLPIVKYVYHFLDKTINCEFLAGDGDVLKNKNTRVAIIKGRARGILSGERVVLNFLQHLSGIATLTRQFVEKAKKYKVEIFDTRKTTPGLRYLEKYAVRIGGGKNHRMGLSDAILIKDNHLKLTKELESHIKEIRTKYGKKYFVEIEASNIRDARYFATLDVDAILLDNMKIKNIQKSVKEIREISGNKKIIEVSGGVSLKNIPKIAQSNVDRISVGAITHSARAIDISLEIIS